MDQVPKVLKPMVEEWTRDGFIVSFKLETEERLLIPKARAALERYGHQVVIGNELHRRKFEVVFVSRGVADRTTRPEPADSKSLSSKAVNDSDSVEVTWLKIDENASAHGKEIEEDIIDELVRRHTAWIGGEHR